MMPRMIDRHKKGKIKENLDSDLLKTYLELLLYVGQHCQLIAKL